LLYKLKFARSNNDVTQKALSVAFDTLKAKINTAGPMFSQGENEGYEAAKTTAITASYEKKRAHDALCDAIDDSQVDTWNARSHKAVRLAELKAVLAEGHTLMERMRLKVTQNKQKDITAITGDMATTTWEDITMEEATTEQNTFTKRLDAAEVRKTEAEDEVEASFLFTEFLLEGCRP
jgi:hypothetical protein